MVPVNVKNFQFAPVFAPVVENPYAREIVKIEAKYRDGWTCSSILAQAESLSAEFPELHLDDVEKDAAKMVCPASADGLGILLKIRTLGHISGVKSPYDSGYSDINRFMLEMIKRNYPDILLPYEVHKGNFIHIYPEVKEEMIYKESLDEKDYRVVPINFGDLKNGYLYSPRKIRWEALVRKDKLPCALPQICALLKSNQGMPTDYHEHLFYCSSADRFNKDFNGRWTYSPCIGILSKDDNRLVLYPQKESYACPGTGSVFEDR